MGVRISDLTAIAEAVATNDLLALVNVSESSDKTKKVTVAQLLAALGTLGVSSGGTGQTSLTAYNVLLGNGTSAVAFAAPGTSGYPLLSQGASANPAFAQVAEDGQTLSDVTTLNVSTSKHGYVPKAPNDTAKFLRGDATWATPSGSASDMLSTLTASEIGVTGATTATISRMHVCSGTSADYTVTLPAVSGNTGKLIGFRMATALTKSVTLDGNGSETIDGATTRLMRAGDSANLLCDGSAWFKVAGNTIPLACRIYRTSSQGSFTNVTVIKVQLNGGAGNSAMLDTANYRVLILRTAMYQLTTAVLMDGSTYSGNVTNAFSRAIQNTNGDGITGTVMETSKYVPGTVAGGPAQASIVSLTAGDNMTLWFHQNSGSTVTVVGASSGAYTYMTLTEIPAW